MKITVINLQRRIRIYPLKVKKIILKALASTRQGITGQINVCFVDDRRMRMLNGKYLGKPEATDVLAFELLRRDKSVVADIVVSTDTAVGNAKIFNTSALYELNLYVVHGILHLLGYNDKTAKQRRRMHTKALSLLGPNSEFRISTRHLI